MSYREEITCEEAREWFVVGMFAELNDVQNGKSVIQDIHGNFWMEWSDHWIDTMAAYLIKNDADRTVMDLEERGCSFGLAKAICDRIDEMEKKAIA